MLKNTQCVFVLICVNLFCVGCWLYNQSSFNTPQSVPNIKLPRRFGKNFALEPEDILVVKEFFKRENSRQLIRNADKFGPITNLTRVVVIRFHDRLDNLKILVDQLANVRGIEDALLIFSQDLYYPEIIDLISSITFARVMHIFYPLAIQLYWNDFPGPAADVCTATANIGLLNQDCTLQTNFPGNSIEIRFGNWSQPKHHFWWMINFVYNNITALKTHEGAFTFLEDDWYVTEDLFWILNSFEVSMINNECDGCNVFSPGMSNNEQIPFPEHLYSEAQVTTWFSMVHNMGVSFNRTLWNLIKSCQDSFCFFNDYNHDYSLMYVSMDCLEKPLRVLVARVPRVFHTGSCGMHTQENDCNPVSKLEIIMRVLKKEFLFPKVLDITNISSPNAAELDYNQYGHGRWLDIRDHQLCLRLGEINP